MKRLLLLLLLSLGFTGSTYADAICKDGWKSTSEGSGTCSWHGGVAQWYPDGTFHDNSQDECYQFNPNDVQTGVGYTNAPMLLGISAGCIPVNSSGSVINDIANAIIEGRANEKASKANTYLPPVIKNSLRNTPFYNVDTTYERYKDASFYGSDGIICTFFNDKEFNCNNGVSYYFSPTKVHGSDGTSYTSNWGNGGNDNYYCVTSSFGSKCCGNWASKVCTKEYILKKEDKPEIADKTTTSTLKSESKTTKKQTTLGFSGLSDLLGFLVGLTFLGLVFWWIFKDSIKTLYPSFRNFIKRFINKGYLSSDSEKITRDKKAWVKLLKKNNKKKNK